MTAHRSGLKALTLYAVLVCAVLGGIAAVGRLGQGRPGAPAANPDAAGTARIGARPAAHVQRQVELFCGDCHGFPSPDSAPREAWAAMVREGFERFRNSPGGGAVGLKTEEVIAYYERHASRLDEIRPPPVSAVGAGSLRFETSQIAAGDSPLDPAVAHIRRVDELEIGGLLFCDMRSGLVAVGDAAPQDTTARALANLSNPCYSTTCDLDGDGRTDLLVADLGSFTPADHEMGKVVWLRPDRQGTFEAIELLTGLGRVASVECGDFNGDQLLDLVVAEFGWQETGRVLLFESKGFEEQRPTFEMQVLDERAGAIHVPIVDLNGDGHLDIVALISQEHEVIEAFLNRGDGSFERRTIYAAENPSYSSSGIEMVDLDGDGDLDVLFANGDGFDSQFLKPYHAIQWLENEGRFPFTYHRLTQMPGVHRALAGDLDLDSDLDIAAVSMLPANVSATYGSAAFDSIVWLEQTQPGVFVRHALENGNCQHAAMELADLDGDGDLDLAVGNSTLDSRARRQKPPAVTIWWNLAIDSRR